MEYKTKSLASRIEWCQRQKTQARTQLEREGWQAEEAGLRDALLNRVHTNLYQHSPPGDWSPGRGSADAHCPGGPIFAIPEVTHKTHARAHGAKHSDSPVGH